MSGEAQLQQVLPVGVTDPKLRQFYAYWQSKRLPGRLPGRQHIDPLEMKPFLPHVMLIDVERGANDALRFRYRLVGTLASSVHGIEATGMYMDEFVPPENYGVVANRLSAVVNTHQPAYGTGRLPWKHLEFQHYEHFDLPLATDGETVDMLFGWRRGFE